MPSAAFIGDIDLINGFKATGAGVFGIEKKQELPFILEAIAKEGYKIVFIMDRWAASTADIIEKYKDRFASVVIIPDYRRELGISKAGIKHAIIEAVGADIANPAAQVPSPGAG